MSLLTEHKQVPKGKTSKRDSAQRLSSHCGEETEASRGRAAFPQTAYISLKAVVIP